jgi:hypothetical protein
MPPPPPPSRAVMRLIVHDKKLSLGDSRTLIATLYKPAVPLV